jgi:uncharacterized damage-inducible protein DinB
MSTSLDHFRRFARYNRWANRRLYDACSALPEGEFARARPSFFGSLSATLNHILVGDTVWLGRFLGEPTAVRSLDQILHAELAPLREAREAMDDRILAFVDGLDEVTLDAVVTYRNMSGAGFSDPLPLLLSHLFNHQTHHRGQAHGLLSHAGAAPPPLDLILYAREVTATRATP